MPSPKKVRVMALSRFNDLLEGVTREPGEEFDATSTRVEEINGAGYGPLVVPVANEPHSRAAKRSSKKQEAK